MRITFRDTCKSRAIALIALPPAYSRRIRTTVSKTNIPISPPDYPAGCLNHRNEGSLLDADHPANGVLFARRSTDAIPRSNAASIAAAAAIGDDRAFRDVSELAAIAMPTLIIPGMDERHPQALAEQLADLLPHGKLAAAAMSDAIVTAEDFARCLAPAIREFLNELPPLPTASAGPD
ncbi:hypothetical protein OVY29_14440 [Sphingopyxis sp. SE2]|uniref:alpha/beta fold hydrolase n=1 Tax=Sphingopyxis sp. SE2 TaxID=1586240 RepID=UPI0028C026DF|nr:hypothetical protein [Sphingopyxis sp. SE2]MDT7529859.1 hypothetical protein [Sphingopyxis sp. SE2]